MKNAQLYSSVDLFQNQEDPEATRKFQEVSEAYNNLIKGIVFSVEHEFR